ncbi:MAG TPA: DUF6279 family lipoprotein [Nevskiaceae bacterium]|nr:DUF6279 family lipoprotein [Nevskiaceae bacterium]
MRKVIFVGAGLVLAACATKLVYQRLDWLINWRLHDYVTLDDAQNARFKTTFADLWAWHRSHELPRYSADLREMADKLDSRVTVTPQQVAAYGQRFQLHWQELMSRTIDSLCDLVRTLDEREVKEILEGIDEKTADFAKEYVAPPEDELRKKSEKRTRKWITRWTGPLNDAQDRLVDDWARKRRAIGKTWLDQRKTWRDQFAAALAARKSSPGCNAFRPLFATPMDQVSDAGADDIAYNQDQWNRLIADVLAAADDRQLKRASSELREMAQQLDELAAMAAK